MKINGNIRPIQQYNCFSNVMRCTENVCQEKVFRSRLLGIGGVTTRLLWWKWDISRLLEVVDNGNTISGILLRLCMQRLVLPSIAYISFIFFPQVAVSHAVYFLYLPLSILQSILACLFPITHSLIPTNSLARFNIGISL